MRKPTRRHRFSALHKGKFEIENTNPVPAIIKLPPRDPLPVQTPGKEKKTVSTGPNITLPRLSGKLIEDWHPVPAVAVPPALRPVPSPPASGNRAFSPLHQGLAALLCVALGALGRSLWPGPAPTPTNAAPPASTREVGALTPAEQEELDAAYAARGAHQFPEAARRFADLGRKHPAWAAMEIEAGVSLLDQGNLDAAETSLQASADKELMPAEANYFLGAVNLENKAYDRARASFARAVALDPSRPEFYYLWGESLRQEGKPLEAAAKFRSALLRNPAETAESFYRLKLWLSEIEADQENSDGSGAQIDGAMARPHPPMEALFAAAARDLRSGDLRAAAGHLLRARRRTDPKIFRTILADPTFAQARSRPELAEIFQPASPATVQEMKKAADAPAPNLASPTHGE